MRIGITNKKLNRLFKAGSIGHASVADVRDCLDGDRHVLVGKRGRIFSYSGSLDLSERFSDLAWESVQSDLDAQTWHN